MRIKNRFFSAGLFLFVFLAAGACGGKKAPAAIGEDVLNPLYWKNQALCDIIPFWEKSIDEDGGGFFTDVEEDGSARGRGNKFTRMVSRIVYGFSAAYMLSGDEKHLKFAKHGMDYMKEYGRDSVNGGWHIYNDEYNEPVMHDKNLFDQTYGNLGPVFYFIATGDEGSLELVRQAHILMKQKAWDNELGGYYAKVGKDWSGITENKSFNSQLDTATAYLIYYYLATGDERLLADLKELAGVVVERMVDKKTGFVGEYYSREWDSLQPDLWAGHNLKTGWVLSRMYYLTGDKKYFGAARKIGDAQIKYLWDDRHGGWFFKFAADDPSSVDDSKDWWTQEEGGNLMLSLYSVTRKKDYPDKFVRTAVFWNSHFIDREYGECFQTLLRDGTPFNKTKGNLYKSAYHTMEQALFYYLYLSLYVHGTDAELYFSLSSGREGKKHYVNLLESKDVILKSVVINGGRWENFSPEQGFVILPKGKNMKIKITYTAKKR